MRGSVNVLLRPAAVAGIGWSGTVRWDEWRTDRAVGAGCADLVPVREVRGMDHADPVLRNRGSLGVYGLPSGCLIQNAGDDGDAHGAWLFEARADAGPGSGRDTIVSQSSSELPERFARLEVPVGAGVPGLVGPSRTTVRLDCPDGTCRGGPAERIEVTASAACTGMSSYHPGPASPAELPAVPRATAAGKADDTRAWYARPESPSRERVRPSDEAIDAPTDPYTFRERCALTPTTDKARTLFDTEYAGTEYAGTENVGPDDAPTSDPFDAWWADVQTFYDQDSPSVRPGSTKGTDAPLAPGTAGRHGQTGLWRATSVCAGAPAVHVLRLRYGYSSLSLRAAPHCERVLRAYVDDVAARRGCTDLEFPSSSTFRAD